MKKQKFPIKSDFTRRNDYRKAVNKLINNEKRKGATFREIATLLNEKNVETMCSGKWHYQSVFRFNKKWGE